MRGATRRGSPRTGAQSDFNPRTPCGVRLYAFILRPMIQHFNPRTPCGVRPGVRKTSDDKAAISIHAPHAGCDGADNQHAAAPWISIHAPHAGCDFSDCFKRFGDGDFNPRTPCGVRHGDLAHGLLSRKISIHAPHAGCDGRTTRVVIRPVISIHAPHAGCDIPATTLQGYCLDFNPRTPCGVRQGINVYSLLTLQFQSTHPMRGATGPLWNVPHTDDNFNPRTPCGVRHFSSPSSCVPTNISIHAPHAGCDYILRRDTPASGYFNPRTPCGVRQKAPSLRRQRR